MQFHPTLCKATPIDGTHPAFQFFHLFETQYFTCTECSWIWIMQFLYHFTFFIEFIVYPSKFGVCVWAQILKRVVVRFRWNFYTIIWHRCAFIFAIWKNFPTTGGFSRATNRGKIMRFFVTKNKNNSMRPTCTKFFMLWKLSEKSLWVIFLLVG